MRECHTLKPTLPYGKRELADILSRALITILKEWQEICHTHRVQSYSNSLKHPNVLLLIYGLIPISGFKGWDFILRFLAMAESEASELCSPEHLIKKVRSEEAPLCSFGLTKTLNFNTWWQERCVFLEHRLSLISVHWNSLQFCMCEITSVH